MTSPNKRNTLRSPRTWNLDIDTYLNRIIPPSPLHRLPTCISWFLGYREHPPEQDVGNILGAVYSFVGAFCGLCVVAMVFAAVDGGAGEGRKGFGYEGVLVGSFGASAILTYNTIHSPLSQPRNAILGHVLSAIIGVGIAKIFALNPSFHHLSHNPSSTSFNSSSSSFHMAWIPPALACGLASAVMLLTGTVHPPGGASAVLAASDPAVLPMGWWFVAAVGLGSAVMVVVGCAINNAGRGGKGWPGAWWTGVDLRGPKKGDGMEGMEDVEVRKMDSRDDFDFDLEIGKMGGVVGDSFQLEAEESGRVGRVRQGMEGRKWITEFGIAVLEELDLDAEEIEFLERLKWRLRERYEVGAGTLPSSRSLSTEVESKAESKAESSIR